MERENNIFKEIYFKNLILKNTNDFDLNGVSKMDKSYSKSNSISFKRRIFINNKFNNKMKKDFINKIIFSSIISRSQMKNTNINEFNFFNINKEIINIIEERKKVLPEEVITNEKKKKFSKSKNLYLTKKRYSKYFDHAEELERKGRIPIDLKSLTL